MKRILFPLLIISIISCKKDIVEHDKDMYAAITVDGVSYYYTMKDSLYSDAWTFTYPSYDYISYAGGFKNINFKLFDYGRLTFDQFAINFNNIPFDSIKKGSYNFAGYDKYGRYNSVGVDITWMNPTIWGLLINKYLNSDEYRSFVKLNPNTNYLISFDDSYLMNSMNSINEGTIIITNIYYKNYERYFFRDSSYKTVQDIIVEGRIDECKIMSRIDTSIVKQLKGDFRIHLPKPQFLKNKNISDKNLFN